MTTQFSPHRNPHQGDHQPRVVFVAHPSSRGAGLPDGGLFAVAKKSQTEPLKGQRPERGVVEIKPPGESLATLAQSAQVLRYLTEYGLCLITNYHQFQLVQLRNGQPSIMESYDLTLTADDLWHLPIATLAKRHAETLPDFLARVLTRRVPLERPKDVAELLASYAREARERAADHPIVAFEGARLSIAAEFPEGTPDRDNRNASRLALTAGWGGAGQGSTVMPRRDFRERDWTPTEIDRLTTLAATQSLPIDDALSILGTQCVDVYLNDAAHWAAVPVNVWQYTLGGYQVLKKWLSYRELPLLGRPLKEDEARYFAQVVRRITAILLMGPALNASYAAILPTATGLPGAPFTTAHPNER